MGDFLTRFAELLEKDLVFRRKLFAHELWFCGQWTEIMEKVNKLHVITDKEEDDIFNDLKEDYYDRGGLFPFIEFSHAWLDHKIEGALNG